MSETKQLSSDNFVRILRPIMMGAYAGNELQEAFDLLDKKRSIIKALSNFSIFLILEKELFDVVHVQLTKHSD
jgi:hypothetical protein